MVLRTCNKETCFCATDPAAETFNYPAAIDIRNLITLEDVMDEVELGPNGCVPARSAAVATLQSLVSHAMVAD